MHIHVACFVTVVSCHRQIIAYSYIASYDLLCIKISETKFSIHHAILQIWSRTSSVFHSMQLLYLCTYSVEPDTINYIASYVYMCFK